MSFNTHKVLHSLSGTIVTEEFSCGAKRCSQVKNMNCTSRQVAYREVVLDRVAGLSVTPTLQAGVFLLRRLQHVVTTQTLEEKTNGVTDQNLFAEMWT